MKRWFWVIDATVIILFAVIGREDHGFVSDIWDYLRVAAPFLLALGISIVVLRAWRDPVYWLTGLALAVGTIVMGMLLRASVWDDGTATSFIVVSAAWMVGLMVGWRLALTGFVRLRRRMAS